MSRTSGVKGRRCLQLADQIQKGLSVLLHRFVNDPRVGVVTVTRVEVTPELRQAWVYFMPFGLSNRSPDPVTEGLSSAAGFLRRQLSRYVKTRYIPELFFCYDNALDRAFYITSLLSRLDPPVSDSFHEQ